MRLKGELNKNSLITIAGNSGLHKYNNNEKYLKDRRLFKTLSLFLADQAGIKTLPSLLLLNRDEAELENFITKWKLPLMIRMDFAKKPSKKTLGGIPIFTFDILIKVIDFLFNNGCFPLIHPHTDRFRNEYGVGVLLNTLDYKAELELVGKGFDAGDIRLGESIPHEIFDLDLIEGFFSGKYVINESLYRIERVNRLERIKRYNQYIDFVNKEGILLPSIEQFNNKSPKRKSYSNYIPIIFKPLPPSALFKLIEFAQLIRSAVIPSLPPSNQFVASLSLTPEFGWVLWDIYGEWYKR